MHILLMLVPLITSSLSEQIFLQICKKKKVVAYRKRVDYLALVQVSGLKNDLLPHR